ncbi:MAG: D-alanine--D-alanine ligase [Zetaproteobacteria bacterium]|nr:MAG: D-alanine--D-alanine ligase [Zetaproteobacteria bacterium]
MRVGVLMGGSSAEREISLQSGRAVSAALTRLGHTVVEVDLTPEGDWIAAIRQARIERAFLALHGTFGEDGIVQGALELLGIPYTGSGVTASALCMDKRLCKALLRAHDIPLPVDIPLDARGRPVRYPVIVKPVAGGSSVGMRRVTRPEELPDGFDGDGWLAEMPVAGVELAVSVLDGRALPPVEVRPAGGLYDYTAKYESARTRYLCPAEIPPESLRGCMRRAERVCALLGCSGAPRVDMILDGGGAAVVLEVNTIPGMTDHSLLPKSAAAAGIGFDELCRRILAGARLHGG